MHQGIDSGLSADVYSEVLSVSVFKALTYVDSWKPVPEILYAAGRRTAERVQDAFAQIAIHCPSVVGFYSYEVTEPAKYGLHVIANVQAITFNLPAINEPHTNLPVSGAAVAYLQFLRYAPQLPEITSGVEPEPEDSWNLFQED